jgi:hypothetical protein
MRNRNQPTLETLTQFRDPAGALWCAQLYYPEGKRKDPRYFIASLSMVGSTVTIPCATIAQLWYEIGLRQQPALPGF